MRQAGANAVAETAAAMRRGGPGPTTTNGSFAAAEGGSEEATAAIRFAVEVRAFAAWPGVAGCATSMVLGRACASNEAVGAADVAEAVRAVAKRREGVLSFRCQGCLLSGATANPKRYGCLFVFFPVCCKITV